MSNKHGENILKIHFQQVCLLVINLALNTNECFQYKKQNKTLTKSQAMSIND